MSSAGAAMPEIRAQQLLELLRDVEALDSVDGLVSLLY